MIFSKTRPRTLAGRLAGSLIAAGAVTVAALAALPAHAQHFQVTNLVSDGFVPAATVDPLLINPWGMSYAPTGPFWVSDNNSGFSTLYDGMGGKEPLNVSIPPPAGASGVGTPTGQVFNATSGFKVTSGGNTAPALFLFATEDGTISGWSPTVDSTHAILAIDNSAQRAVYKGLAIATEERGTFLYAANFRIGDVEVYNSGFHLVKAFSDPTLPPRYAPFNVQVLNGLLYVTFAMQDFARHDDVAGPHHGFVDVFTLNGVLVQRLVTRGRLNSPWGLDIAPATFGPFGGDLLVGNFGDGKINAFDPTTGAYKGTLLDTSGQPLVEGDLWALINGNGGSAGDPNTVYFSAGLVEESHGLLGAISPAP